MTSIIDSSPRQFAQRMLDANVTRGYLVYDAHSHALNASHPMFAELADWLLNHAPDFQHHEAVFLAVGPDTGALFAAFIHDTRRGQAQGGLRRWHYDDTASLLRDGLRLSAGMTRKNALASLWWGGGKGIIAADASDPSPEERSRLYREYGAFVSSLRGCYLTAEDVGTHPLDIGEVFSATRFVTCIAPELGGSGNPSAMTAAGVVAAMEAAVDASDLDSLDGKTIAMQGTGHVGSAMIPLLFERGVRQIVASDLSESRRAALLDAYADLPLEVRLAERGDLEILSHPCDILVPAALGGVLNPKAIPQIRASIVCGPANNQLLEEARDSRALADRGILYVPDYVANRMGIVYCGNEQYGYVNGDPRVKRHLDRAWPRGIYQTTRRVLSIAKASQGTTVAAANRMADELAEREHPIWGHRSLKIIESLVADHWERGQSA
jgi:glutamate dehydrogenase/leucine dehydrogenase